MAIEPTDYEITDILNIYTDEESRKLPWDDEGAWDRYPFLRWAYNKRALVTYLNQDVVRTGKWVHKPEINFWGLGRGASVKDHELIEKGYFAMPYIYGDLYSTDFLIDGGRFLGSMTFKTKNVPEDIHNKVLWEGIKTPSEGLKTDLHKLITEHFETFTGMLNVEHINGVIIELHLRPSAQFYWAKPEIIHDWINIMTGQKQEFFDYEAGGLGSLVIRHELDYDEVPEQIHVMRLNPSDDLAAANRRRYLVSGPMAVLRHQYKSHPDLGCLTS